MPTLIDQEQMIKMEHLLNDLKELQYHFLKYLSLNTFSFPFDNKNLKIISFFVFLIFLKEIRT